MRILLQRGRQRRRRSLQLAVFYTSSRRLIAGVSKVRRKRCECNNKVIIDTEMYERARSDYTTSWITSARYTSRAYRERYRATRIFTDTVLYGILARLVRAPGCLLAIVARIRSRRRHRRKTDNDDWLTAENDGKQLAARDGGSRSMATSAADGISIANNRSPSALGYVIVSPRNFFREFWPRPCR